MSNWTQASTDNAMDPIHRESRIMLWLRVDSIVYSCYGASMRYSLSPMRIMAQPRSQFHCTVGPRSAEVQYGLSIFSSSSTGLSAGYLKRMNHRRRHTGVTIHHQRPTTPTAPFPGTAHMLRTEYSCPVVRPSAALNLWPRRPAVFLYQAFRI